MKYRVHCKHYAYSNSEHWCRDFDSREEALDYYIFINSSPSSVDIYTCATSIQEIAE